MQFHLDTEYPVALDSPDHIEPRGTVRDNSTNPAFNKWLAEKKPGANVLDLGCAGGGLVRTLLRDGFTAVGLEGSDTNLKAGNHEWPYIPDNLFTCDVGRPFVLHTGNGKPFRFDVVTAWEFFEHIPEDRIDQVLWNIKAHLKDYGLVICSISDCASVWKEMDHHQTRQPLHWWITKFADHWFRRRTDIESELNRREAWVRKVKYNAVFQEDQW